MDFPIRLLFLALLLASVEFGPFQQSASQPAKQPTSTEPELEVMNRIVERKYCSSGGMLLTLETKYKNVGKRNLIVVKNASPPYQYRISRNMDAARAKRYEQIVTPIIGWGSSSIQFGDEPPDDYFVILEPGQDYTPDNVIVIPMFIAAAKQEISKESLGPGEHVLELTVVTWPFWNQPESELRSRWQRFGYLWTKEVLTVPTVLGIAEFHERALSNCNTPSQLQR